MSGSHEPGYNPQYKVVVNHEEQYSIWPLDRENPAGWSDEGTSGTKDECLAHINEVWQDMRPLSLRQRMAAAAADTAADTAANTAADTAANTAPNG